MSEETEIDRIAALFMSRIVQYDHNMQPTNERHARGMENLAKAIGVHRTALAKWKERHQGRIPLTHRAKLIAACDDIRLPREKLAEALDPICCPTCGQKVEVPQK